MCLDSLVTNLDLKVQPDIRRKLCDNIFDAITKYQKELIEKFIAKKDQKMSKKVRLTNKNYTLNLVIPQ